MFVQDHHTLEELQQLTKALTQKRIWLRDQAVVLAKQGDSAPDDRPRPGLQSPRRPDLGRPLQPGRRSRPSRTGPTPAARPAWRDRSARFQERLEAPPTPEDGVCTLRVPDIRRILRGGVRRDAWASRRSTTCCTASATAT